MPVPGRDQAADDDVLLEAAQVVDLAVDGRLGQHARRLLERRRRDERVGRRLALVMPSSSGSAFAGLPSSVTTRSFSSVEAEAVDLLAEIRNSVSPTSSIFTFAASGERSPRCACR
jgi:hypothetical protein